MSLRLTSFHWGSVVSLKTRVLALLTKYPNESTSRVQYRSESTESRQVGEMKQQQSMTDKMWSTGEHLKKKKRRSNMLLHMFNCRRRVLDRYIYRSLCGNLIAAEDTWHFKAPYKNNHMNIRRKAHNIQTLSLSEHLRDDFGQTSFQWKTSGFFLHCNWLIYWKRSNIYSINPPIELPDI